MSSGQGVSLRQPPSYLTVALQLAGAALILIGAFTPWVRSHVLFLTVPVSGIKTDYGRLFPFVALAVVGLLAYQWSFGWRRWAAAPVLILGVVAMTVAILYAAQVKERVGRADDAMKRQPQAPFVVPGGTAVSVDFDVGYYLTLLGAGSAVAGAVGDLLRRR